MLDGTFPRTRGGDPQCGGGVRNLSAFSPHARG